MNEKKFPDLYKPLRPCGGMGMVENAEEVEIGPLCSPCPAHGHYAVRFYGATFSQSSTTGQVTVVNKHAAMAVLNAN